MPNEQIPGGEGVVEYLGQPGKTETWKIGDPQTKVDNSVVDNSDGVQNELTAQSPEDVDKMLGSLESPESPDVDQEVKSE